MTAPAPSISAAEQAERSWKWNFVVIVLDAVAFAFGMAAFDMATVLPVVLAKLDAPDWLIGLARAVQLLGFTLPALLAAHYIHGRASHKRFLMITVTIGRFGLLTLPAMFLWFAVENPILSLAWFFAVWSVFWLMDGACAVSWFDMIGKTIPARVRGRFFGMIQMVSGMVAVAAGWVVAKTVDSSAFPYPKNYALLTGLWVAGAIVSTLFLLLIREPVEPSRESTEPRLSFVAFLKQIRPLWRRNPSLGRLVICKFLFDSSTLAMPFYVLFSQRDLALAGSMVGVYLSAKAIARILTGPFWGWIADRRGHMAAFRVLGLVVLLVPCLAVLATKESSWLLLVAFFLMGSVDDAIWMIPINAVIGSVSDEDRPLATAVCAVFQTPTAVFPPLGGLLAASLGYKFVFAVTGVVVLAGAILSLKALPGQARAASQG